MQLNNIHPSQIAEATTSKIPGKGDLRIVLTSACNLRCSHCHNEGNLPPWAGPKNDITVPQIEDLISVAARYGARSVKFTGGDPTVYRHFLELLSIVKVWRVQFPSVEMWGISTNGVAFLKRKYFEALLNSGLDNVCVGIDSLESTELSKPSSKVGVAGSRLFSEFVQPLAARWPADHSIKINVVFDGNVERVARVVSACVTTGVDVSIIELNGIMGDAHETRDEFIKMYERLREQYAATEYYNEELNQFTLIPAGKEKRICFYQDHCADFDCGHCRNLHLRISPETGQLKAIPCFLQDQDGGYQVTIDGKIDSNRFRTAIDLNGRGPKWRELVSRYE